MYPHDYTQKALFAARIYVNEIMTDDGINQGSYSILRIRAYALSELVSIPDALFCIYMLM